jgi:hypothetical protein
MGAVPFSSAKSNHELEFYARLGREWLQSKPILKCKQCGSNLDFFVNSIQNEFGHFVYVWCEECVFIINVNHNPFILPPYL